MLYSFLIFLLLAPFAMITAGNEKSVHDFTIKTLDGKDLPLSQFKGKKILIVNTASECGYTPQYEGLEKLYKEHKDKLIVIGFPSNEFGGQEPGTNAEIGAFCQKNYGVTFPMSEKVDVKGDDATPLYKFLGDKKRNGVTDEDPKWNFCKYLIDENGRVIQYFSMKVEPTDEQITKLI